MTVPLVVASVALIMIVCERAAPGRSWPTVAGWWTRALTHYWWHRWRHEIGLLWRWLHLHRR
jgi:hypothetical protein